ncbi:MAG: hypothetical protein MK172_11675 [Verrucomicrobiales bacterium]|nr:hypothetical protein [Verrucomicrobiales bacterium]
MKFIYHPEGVIRLARQNDQVDRNYHYDYFIKDYLGNVRVVISEQYATEETAFLSTLEDFYAELEEKSFDNLDDTRADLPANYPVDGSAELNERIAYLSAEDDMVIGPSIVVETKRGGHVDLAVDYFYEENAPGATYDNLGFLVNEVLVSLAASAAGVIPTLQEAQLNNIASGNTNLGGQILQLLTSAVDTNNLSRPQGYLVYLAIDTDNKLVESSSGAIQVGSANQLQTILRNGIETHHDGYMHVYLSNGSSAKGINFDNFYVKVITGKTRQINNYYPYGLQMAGMGAIRNDYLNKYTSKEHQTGEFDDFGVDSRGIEMFDFHARFFDPQLARWAAPDPAMQFSNPYLGIGNNPVSMIDPDGRAAFFYPSFSIDNGAVSIGFNFSIGFKGGADLQFGFGVSNGINGYDPYGYAGVGLGPVNATVGYSDQGGAFTGVNVGLGGPAGLSSNFHSAGVNYSQNFGWSASAGGFNFSEAGLDFSPSITYSPQFSSELEPVYKDAVTASAGGPQEPVWDPILQVYLRPVYIYPPELVGYIAVAMFGHGNKRPVRPPKTGPQSASLNPHSLGKNLGFSNYLGASNPTNWNGTDNFEVAPTNRADLGGYVHDLAYFDLGIKGASGLFTSVEAIPADLAFANYQFMVARTTNSPLEFFQAALSGTFVGAVGLTKKSMVYVGSNRMRHYPVPVY